MVLRTKPAGKCGNLGVVRYGVWLACLLVFATSGGQGWSQRLPEFPGDAAVSLSSQPGTENALAPEAAAAPSVQWEGLPVRSIAFEGVGAGRLDPLPGHLAQGEGKPLSGEALQSSLRQLYATGLYDTIEVAGTLEKGGVDLVFRGTPRTFIGTVSVNGAKGANVNTQLMSASRLTAGTRFTTARLNRALDRVRQMLADNGFHEPAITHSLTPHPDEQLVDIVIQVVSGPQSRVGAVTVTGDAGMSVEEFRRHAGLRIGARVDHDTGNRALAGVLKYYRAEQRLEAEIKIESDHYDAATRKTDFHFTANRGPVVKVRVEGTNLSQERTRQVIPIYEEGAVDEDLLNEGNRRLRDYYQRLGYFDVKVAHEQQSRDARQVEIVYKVSLGPRRRVEEVSVTGNHYFDKATLKDLLSVHAADVLDRHGTYSQALVAADVGALQSVYQNNGFSEVKITPETSTPETVSADSEADTVGGKAGAGSKTAPLSVVYRIEEGKQQRVGSVRIEGNEHVGADKLIPLMNTTAGQLYSPRDLAGDREVLLTCYYSRGFEQVHVEMSETREAADPDKVDVVFRIDEGPQIFVRNVLLTGLHYTHPDTVARAITLHPGDPLNQTALMETQRNLYDYALFNEVDTAVENPTGGETRKTILLQVNEARRWTLTYGFGFEAQTGTPQFNCGGVIASGSRCNPNGKTGVSPRVVADLTRNNLFGREQSISLRGNYGLLEQKLDLLFQIPRFKGNRNLGLTFSGGYANSLDVTTYVASKLVTGVRLTENFLTPGTAISKANTLVYEFDFHRVKVEASSLQVAPSEIAQESTAERVAGPGLTWIRDTRDSPLDAHRGTYTSIQEFLSAREFGAQVQFNRLDVSNSSYYSFGKGKYVLARNTRYGQERSFGTASEELIPLPERLYAGGTTSLRGFPINAAGPRDPETGYPVGGAGALINSTELRLPPPMLPWFGDTLSFVLFHDMGNVFTNASDAWASALRVRQPDRSTCENLKPLPKNAPTNATGLISPCSFNYFSHAPGIGLRYHTPAGPIRLDFSYNLNPPIYPVIYNYSQTNVSANPYVGEASHFNFFFSLGQTF
jgi:outer membrane protein assembly complex protein YaeT